MGFTDLSSMATVAPGWEAIDRALKRLYPETAPLHLAPPVPSILGGNDPLDGISAYQRREPVAHWHYVTYGFSELYEKERQDPDWSGFGFELTFRLLDHGGNQTTPRWPFRFLQSLARHIVGGDHGVAPGHTMSLNGPITTDGLTQIEAIAYVLDPELGSIDTPHGRLQFLQVVGLHQIERRAIVEAGGADRFLAVARDYLPLFVTDLDRAAILPVGTLE